MAENKSDEGQEPIRVNTREEFDRRVWPFGEKRSPREVSKRNHGKWAGRMEVAAVVSWLLLCFLFGLHMLMFYAAAFTCGFFGLCGWAERLIDLGDRLFGLVLTVMVSPVVMLGVLLGTERLSKMNYGKWAEWARAMDVAAGISWLLLYLLVWLHVLINYAAVFTCVFFGLCGWAERWLDLLRPPFL